MKNISIKARLKKHIESIVEIEMQKRLLEIKENENLEKNIKDMIKKAEAEEEHISNMINLLDNSECKIILQLRYLHLYSWNDINEFLYNRHDDFLVEKNSKYERRMFRLHNQAIKLLNKSIYQT